MDEEIKKLLEQNLKLTQEIHAMARKIKGHLAFQRLVSIFYLIIIIAPIILGVIFLPPLLKPMIDQYKDLLGLQSNTGASSQNLDLNNLPAQLKGLLGK